MREKLLYVLYQKTRIEIVPKVGFNMTTPKKKFYRFWRYFAKYTQLTGYQFNFDEQSDCTKTSNE